MFVPTLSIRKRMAPQSSKIINRWSNPIRQCMILVYIGRSQFEINFLFAASGRASL